MAIPNVAGALAGWTRQIMFQVISKAVKDFEAVESKTPSKPFPGVLQPLNPQKVKIKPEGERIWAFWTLYTKQNIRPDNIVQDTTGRKFRVMEKTDWSESGFYKYQLGEMPYP